MNKRTTGSEHEQIAGRYLKDNNVNIIEYNYSIRTGEIDIVGKDGEDLVFFEVKYRSSNSKGYASDAVDIKKQYKICRVSDHYMLTHDISYDTQIRYDVIAMDADSIEWIKNAFDYIPKS